MTFDFTSGSVGKLNRSIPGAPPASGGDDGSKSLAEVFRQADANGDGSLSLDEFKGLGRDALREAADPSRFGGEESLQADLERALSQLRSSTAVLHSAGGKYGAAVRSLQAVRGNLDRLVAASGEREQALRNQLESADSQALAHMIQVQLAQLGRTKGHLEAMRAQVQGVEVPKGATPKVLGRFADALGEMQEAVKRIAGADASELLTLRVSFEHSMAQLRAPQRDLSRDMLTNTQFALLMDVSRMLALMSARMAGLSREAMETPERKFPGDAYMHQLTQRYLDYTRLFDALIDYRPPALAPRRRQEAAEILSRIHQELMRAAEADVGALLGLVERLQRQDVR